MKFLIKLPPLWRRGLMMMLALVAVVTLHACGLDRFATPVDKVSQVVIPTPSGPATFNYPLNQSAYSVFGFLYEGLISENPVTGNLEPNLAESWEISPDKQRIAFTLRSGLKWSDGEPLTADDVVFTYNSVYLNQCISTGLKDILRVGLSRTFPKVEKLDEQRIQFIISEPFAPFLRFVGGLPILPAHSLRETTETYKLPEKELLAKLGGEEAFTQFCNCSCKRSEAESEESECRKYLSADVADKTLEQIELRPKYMSTWGVETDPQTIVGSGPYTMERFIPVQWVFFRQNPYYWRRDEGGNAQPYIERVVLKIIESSNNQLIQFRAGELDNLSTPPEAFELLKGEEKQGRFTIYEGGPDPSTRFVGFNLNRASRKPNGEDPLVDPIKSGWFNTLAFRQAVAYAIDRETMKENIFRDLGIVQHSPLYVTSPYYLSPAEGLKVYQYNPQKSRELLLGAGFRYNARDELEDAAGNRVQFTLLVKAEEKTRVDMAVKIQENLEAIGMKVDLQTLNFNSILERLGNGDWECYVGGFGGGSLEPHSGFNIWSSSGRLHQFNQSAQPGQPPLYGRVVTDWEKEIDRLFVEGARELDETKRQAIYAEFQQIVQEQVPFFYLVNQLSLDAVRDRVKGVQYTARGGAFWNIYEHQVVE